MGTTVYGAMETIGKRHSLTHEFRQFMTGRVFPSGGYSIERDFAVFTFLPPGRNIPALELGSGHADRVDRFSQSHALSRGTNGIGSDN